MYTGCWSAMKRVPTIQTAHRMHQSIEQKVRRLEEDTYGVLVRRCDAAQQKYHGDLMHHRRHPGSHRPPPKEFMVPLQSSFERALAIDRVIPMLEQRGYTTNVLRTTGGFLARDKWYLHVVPYTEENEPIVVEREDQQQQQRQEDPSLNNYQDPISPQDDEGYAGSTTITAITTNEFAPPAKKSKPSAAMVVVEEEELVEPTANPFLEAEELDQAKANGDVDGNGDEEPRARF